MHSFHLLTIGPRLTDSLVNILTELVAAQIKPALFAASSNAHLVKKKKRKEEKSTNQTRHSVCRGLKLKKGWSSTEHSKKKKKKTKKKLDFVWVVRFVKLGLILGFFAHLTNQAISRRPR